MPIWTRSRLIQDEKKKLKRNLIENRYVNRNLRKGGWGCGRDNATIAPVNGNREREK